MAETEHPLGDPARLRPMIDRAQRLTRDELLMLANDHDRERSRELRRPVWWEIKMGWEWALFGPEVFELSDLVHATAAAYGLEKAQIYDAWEAIADEMTARLFAEGLSEPTMAALGAAWGRLD